MCVCFKWFDIVDINQLSVETKNLDSKEEGIRMVNTRTLMIIKNQCCMFIIPYVILHFITWIYNI